MHNAQVNVIWPVGIFFSKEIHNTKLIKASLNWAALINGLKNKTVGSWMAI
jgi:hypothetical protein